MNFQWKGCRNSRHYDADDDDDNDDNNNKFGKSGCGNDRKYKSPVKRE